MYCKLPAVFLMVPGIFLACTNLKPLQQLSEEARKGLGHFQKLGYTYTESCTMDCKFQKVRAFEIYRDLDCDCNSYQQADDLVTGLVQTMDQYWLGLSTLASPGLTTYDLSVSVGSVQSSGFVNLSEGEVSAIQKLAEFTVNSSTGNFRRNRMLHYMKEADPYLRILTDKLSLVMEQNLLGLLEIQREYWYMHYKNHAVNAELSAVEKEWAVEKYYALLEDSEKIRLRIESTVAMMNLIADKHHSLSQIAEKVGDVRFRSEVSALSEEIRNLYVVFEQVNE
jgi:hypothetical protein